MKKGRLTQRAANAFASGDYTTALRIYRELSELISKTAFRINIERCKERLQGKRDIAKPQTLHVLSSAQYDYIDLTHETPTVELSISADCTIEILGSIRYSEVVNPHPARALASVKYFDAEGRHIEGSFKGLANSEKYGPYCYLHDTAGKVEKLLTLWPPSVTAYAKVEFHSFCIKQGESVFISNQIYSNWKTKEALSSPTIHEMHLPTIGWPSPTKKDKVCMMTILDEFSRDCFAPHINLIEPRPDNAIALIERDKPELLFVESSWRGNKSTWQYRVARYANPPGDELSKLITECKQRDIPTVFWNKEDPVHFDNFIDSAEGFDHIFTTAEEAVSLYQNRSNAKTYVMPFAAESSIHNPISSGKRNNRICFAGSYYAQRFRDRRDDQLMLLDAAASFELDIYDRNFGCTSSDFCFPDRFKNLVRGRLDYSEMSKAYKAYRVFLNVNSVINSKTMFSRRIFELLASGTPVVSTPSRGIDEMFGPALVFTVNNETEAKEAISWLMSDQKEWSRRSIQGIREIFARHTYLHRIDYIMRTVGLSKSFLSQRRVLLVGEASTRSDAESLIEMQARQSLVRTSTHLLIVADDSEVQVSSPEVKTVVRPERLKEFIDEEIKSLGATHIALLESNAHYGTFFLQDSLNAFDYSKCLLAGKPSSTNDVYEYSADLLDGSIIISSDHFLVVKTPASSLSDMAKNFLECTQHHQSFATDDANYLPKNSSHMYRDINQLIRSIEI